MFSVALVTPRLWWHDTQRLTRGEAAASLHDIYVMHLQDTCFPANCVEPMHLDSLLVGKECI